MRWALGALCGACLGGKGRYHCPLGKHCSGIQTRGKLAQRQGHRVRVAHMGTAAPSSGCEATCARGAEAADMGSHAALAPSWQCHTVRGKARWQRLPQRGNGEEAPCPLRWSEDELYQEEIDQRRACAFRKGRVEVKAKALFLMGSQEDARKNIRRAARHEEPRATGREEDCRGHRRRPRL